MAEKLKITLVKSLTDAVPRQETTVAAFGLTKIQKAVETPDSGTVRDMIASMRHLVEVGEI